MKTRIYRTNELDNKDVQQDIKTTLNEGRNVVFPTETVYGIGASAFNQNGIQGIYHIKGRPSDNPLIMHLHDTSNLEDYVYISQPYINDLIQAFWPGPMTLVFEKKDIVPDYFTGGLSTVGIRIPSSEVAKKIIEIAGVPICAPSANISGRPSSTLFKHVVEDFNNKADILIDGGKSEVGLESTVIDVTKEVPVILRPGMITYDMIKEVTNKVEISRKLVGDQVPKAPGMKYKHYAPKAKLYIVEGTQDQVVDYINNQIHLKQNTHQKIGVIITTNLKDKMKSNYVYEIGTEDNELEIASNLFAALREMDELEVDLIYSVSFQNGKYKEAIMNRLLKAANNRVIKL